MAEKIAYIRTMRRGSDGIDTSGGGGEGSNMEARIVLLETDVKALIKEVAEIKGLLKNMPTTFQMMSWYAGIAIGLCATVFTIARTTGTH